MFNKSPIIQNYNNIFRPTNNFNQNTRITRQASIPQFCYYKNATRKKGGFKLFFFHKITKCKVTEKCSKLIKMSQIFINKLKLPSWAGVVLMMTDSPAAAAGCAMRVMQFS